MQGWGSVARRAALGVLASCALAPSAAAQPQASNDGLVWNGLLPGLAGTACEGLFEIDGTDLCTHGPDSAAATTSSPPQRQGRLVEAGGAPFCTGDGTSGDRVQAVYAYPAGGVDGYEKAKETIAELAGIVDRAYDDSAALTGGSTHVRWAMDPGTCSLSVLKVALSEGAIRSFNAMLTEFRSAGLLARSDRKYVVWADASVYCGIATFRVDDDPAPSSNLNNGLDGIEAGVARIDRGCWDDDRPDVIRYAAQHELTHLLGGVQPSAPHATQYSHCSDEWDALCYADGPATSTLTFACTERAFFEDLLDCNADDYFSSAPPAGSYLDSHWNVYESGFLHPSDTPEPGTPEVAPEAASTPTAPQTSKLSGPPRRTTSRTATFRFESSPGTTFECRLDQGGWTPCASPAKFRALALGSHVFRVAAISAAGLREQAPARWRFRVVD